MSLFLKNLLDSLPLVAKQHARLSSLYQLLDPIIQQEIEKLFHAKDKVCISFGSLGDLSFPYFKMGAVDSLDLFGLDELILFSYYWSSRHKYKKVLDIGANIGLHTTVMAKCGYSVQSFEPDPIHFNKLQEVLSANGINSVQLHQAAVSNRTGESTFVRVLGNTTSSHLANAKNSYGPTDEFSVKVFDIRLLMKDADLMKLDVEGHEATIIGHTKAEDWQNVDAIVEVGSTENASLIYNHLQKEGVHAFAQKTGWNKITCLEEMPTSYKEGSLFISAKPLMTW